MEGRAWIVSYDNVAPIGDLYSGFRNVVYHVGYTARENRVGREVMFFAPMLKIPALVGPIKHVGGNMEAA
jgi:DNA adenine methylase